jgi:hypothetical protein
MDFFLLFIVRGTLDVSGGGALRCLGDSDVDICGVSLDHLNTGLYTIVEHLTVRTPPSSVTASLVQAQRDRPIFWGVQS